MRFFTGVATTWPCLSTYDSFEIWIHCDQCCSRRRHEMVKSFEDIDNVINKCEGTEQSQMRKTAEHSTRKPKSILEMASFFQISCALLLFAVAAAAASGVHAGAAAASADVSNDVEEEPPQEQSIGDLSMRLLLATDH